MSLVKCPKCQELYSDTYKSCPFCEEVELYTKKPRRAGLSGGQRVLAKRTPKIVGPALVVVLVLLAAVLIYAFFGSQIRDLLHGSQADPEQEEPVVEEPMIEVKPTAVEMEQGDIQALTVSGAQDYVWRSSDEEVVSVNEEGVLTAHAVGTATITVTDGDGHASAQCRVTVVDSTETPDPEGGGEQDSEDTTTADTSALSMKTLYGPLTKYEGKYDLTIKVNEPLQLQIEGAAGQVTWRTSDAAVLTVDADGTLHPVKAGSAEITATVDGKALKCIVRVK